MAPENKTDVKNEDSSKQQEENILDTSAKISAKIEDNANNDAKSKTPSKQDVKNEDKQLLEDKEARIPRHRLNEEIEQKKLLVEQVNILRQQNEMLMQQVPKKQVQQEDEFAQEVKSLEDEFGWDEETAKKMVARQRSIAQREVNRAVAGLQGSVANLTSDIELNKVFLKYPKAKEYETEVKAKLATVPPHIKSDPFILEQITLTVLGAKFNEAIAEAEERGVKRSGEKQTIMQSKPEIPASSANAKKIVLSEDEKRVAEMTGLTEEEYFESKRKLKKNKG